MEVKTNNDYIIIGVLIACAIIAFVIALINLKRIISKSFRKRKFIKKVRPTYQATILNIGAHHEFNAALMDYLYSEEVLNYYIKYGRVEFRQHMIDQAKVIYSKLKDEWEYSKEILTNEIYESYQSKNKRNTTAA